MTKTFTLTHEQFCVLMSALQHAIDVYQDTRQTRTEAEAEAVQTELRRQAKAQLEAANETVWVLTIIHPHGEDTWVRRTAEAVEKILLDYVTEWWEKEKGDIDEMPEEPSDRIGAYFEDLDEWYALQECEVKD